MTRRRSEKLTRYLTRRARAVGAGLLGLVRLLGCAITCTTTFATVRGKQTGGAIRNRTGASTELRSRDRRWRRRHGCGAGRPGLNVTALEPDPGMYAVVLWRQPCPDQANLARSCGGWLSVRSCSTRACVSRSFISWNLQSVERWCLTLIKQRDLAGSSYLKYPLFRLNDYNARGNWSRKGSLARCATNTTQPQSHCPTDRGTLIGGFARCTAIYSWTKLRKRFTGVH